MTEKAKGYWRMEPNFPGPQEEGGDGRPDRRTSKGASH